MRPCPHCRSIVEPLRNAQGDVLCPVCRNTGRPSAASAAPIEPLALAGETWEPVEAWEDVEGVEGWEDVAAQVPAPVNPGNWTPSPSAPPYSGYPPQGSAPGFAAPYPQGNAPGAVAPAYQSYPQANAPGAVASLVLGIVSFFLSIFGFVTAILAINFAKKAQSHIDASGGRLDGAGLAKAGRILGWVFIALFGLVAITVIMAAIVFVLVSEPAR